MIKLGCFFQRLVCILISTGIGEFLGSVGCFFAILVVFQKMVMIVLFGDIDVFNDTMIITNCLCNDCCGNGCSGCPCHSWVRLSGVAAIVPTFYGYAWVMLSTCVSSRLKRVS